MTLGIEQADKLHRGMAPPNGVNNPANVIWRNTLVVTNVGCIIGRYSGGDNARHPGLARALHKQQIGGLYFLLHGIVTRGHSVVRDGAAAKGLVKAGALIRTVGAPLLNARPIRARSSA